MGQTTADFLLERLHENGVRRIYGYPGDGINAIVGALERYKDKIEFVQVRHEEMAAFMACAHAKWTGRGRRLPRDLRPRRDPPPERPLRREARPRSRCSRSSASRRAWRSAATTSRRSTCSRCSRTSRTSTARWRSTPAQIRHLVDRAHRIALDQRSVTCLIIPNDLAEEAAVPEPPREARHDPLVARLVAAAHRAGAGATCSGRRRS